jgi:hypothetical protein
MYRTLALVILWYSSRDVAAEGMLALASGECHGGDEREDAPKFRA